MHKKKKKPSSYEVAKLAGVSPSTISRFINRTSFVSDDKAKKIQDAINELGYQSKLQNNSNNKRRSLTIGALIQHPDSPYTSQILNDMEKVLIDQGYSFIIASGHWQQKLGTHALQYLRQNNVDGVIIVTGNLQKKQIIEFAKQTPVITVGYDIEDTNIRSINVDNELGGYIATRHLLQQGHVNIAHIKGLADQPDSLTRFRGYQRALNEWGLPINPALIRQGDFSAEEAYSQTLELIKNRVKFSAIFAANDLSAYGVIKALHDSNLKVPDDVSVIGFDDIYTSKYFTPALTTLRQPIHALGTVSAHSILNLIEGKKYEAKIPPIDLIIRDSTRIVNKNTLLHKKNFNAW